MKSSIYLALAFLLISSCQTRPSQIRFAMACINGDTRLVKGLAESYPIDVNAINGPAGPCLTNAAYGGHREIAEFVLNKDANVNVRDQKGLTPLMYAVVGQKIEMVRFLLEKGADPNLYVITENGEDRKASTLAFAKVKGNPEIISLIENEISGKK